MSLRELNFPTWAQPAAPLFRALLDKCVGSYRVHITEKGESRLEVSFTLSPQNIASVAEVAKRLNLP